MLNRQGVYLPPIYIYIYMHVLDLAIELIWCTVCKAPMLNRQGGPSDSGI